MKEKILAKVEECFLIAEKFYNTTFPRATEVIFKRNGTCGGYCRFNHTKTIRIFMFQLDFAEAYPEDYIENTVPHEVAHYIQFMVYGFSYQGIKVHGKEWKYIMRNVFKVEPTRTHDYSLSVTKTRNTRIFVYGGCGCGKTYQLTYAKHKKAQLYVDLRGCHIYNCSLCKNPVKFITKVSNSIDNEVSELQKQIAQLQAKIKK
jgi:SprT protein